MNESGQIWGCWLPATLEEPLRYGRGTPMIRLMARRQFGDSRHYVHLHAGLGMGGFR